MEKNITPAFANLSSGKRAVILVADSSNKQNLCIVPVPVLEHLISFVPKTRIEDIIESFSTKASECNNVDTWKQLLQDELDFHSSVDLVREYFATEAKEESLSEHAMQRMV